MISGATIVAGVAGRPVSASLSPVIHNAWIKAAGIDAVYVAVSPTAEGFSSFVRGCRGGAVRGLNVTAPFKEAALSVADRATPTARRAGAANLLLFGHDGSVFADNTDGQGLLEAFTAQAPGFDAKAGPAIVIGAGGAARGAVAAFLDAGAPAVVLLNRSAQRALELVDLFGSRVTLGEFAASREPLLAVNAVINATPAEPQIALEWAPSTAVVMDMVYRPLQTEFLRRAAARGLRTVDGLAMLIEQARPSFEAFFGIAPPAVDVRALALTALTGAK